MNSEFIVINSDVGGDWNMNFICPYIGNVIIPTDFHIFQSSWNNQPAIYIYMYVYV